MKALSDYFIRKTRDDGTTFVTLSDDRPEWLRDAVMAAHDGEMPNDWRYETCASIVAELADGYEPYEIADSLVDVYNHDLVRWLSGDTSRSAYCDDFVDQYAPRAEGNDVWNMIRGGQWLAISRMVDILADAITENMDDES